MSKEIKIFVLLMSFIFITSSSLLWNEENSNIYTFEDYIIEFKRNYDIDEYHNRKQIFEENLRKINEINNSSELTWKAGVNEFSDKYENEVKSLRGFKRISQNLISNSNSNSNSKQRHLKQSFDSKTEYPKALNWVEKGVVNPIKNQRSCGSCWAFAAVGVLESRNAIRTGELKVLSEQQVVDCAPNVHHCGGTGGCDGSDQTLAFDYIRSSKGVALESDYQYEAKNGQCRDKEVEKYNTEVVGFNLLAINNLDALMEAIQDGPVSIAADASKWHFYRKGIIQSKDCGAEGNHAVILMGYGEEENGQKYWIVRNSWGESWGENGYIRLARENSNKEVRCFVDLNPASGGACDNGPSQNYVCGTCGMYQSSTYPVFGK